MKIVKFDVSQGSTPGPLLFLIFVNNSAKVLHDDMRIFFETANQELDQINGWFLANKLSLIVETTKYTLFHKRTDQDNIPLKLPSLQLSGTT